MKVLYIECSMGAAGDMLMSALYELLDDKQGFLDTMNSLGLPDVRLTADAAASCGIRGTHMRVEVHGQEEMDVERHSCGEAHDHAHLHSHDHEHPHGHDHAHPHPHVHSTPETIAELIDGLALPGEVKRHARSVYDGIALAEAQAHGCPVGDVHYHEVGALDAVADVTGVCYALYLLHPDRIVVSPVHVGSGQVRCAHGLVPVPAPATAHLLKGIPCYGGEIKGELCTPTGAALLAHFGQEFGAMPVMKTERIGYGIGKRKFPAANCVRAFLGEAGDPQQAAVTELCCHIDDMTAEALAFAGERLLERGALDISCTPMTMKKGRAGVAFTVLCRPKDEERLAQAILRETNTNGVRSRRCGKYILTPHVRTIETVYGPMRIKCADGVGIHREKPEYEDVAAAAERTGLSFQQIWEAVLTQMQDR